MDVGVCVQCGYHIYKLHGVWVYAWDEDEVCYDEHTNMIAPTHNPER